MSVDRWANRKDKQADTNQENESKNKKKEWWVSYLPALFIALMTIAILVLIILGTMFANQPNQNAQSRALHGIDFTSESAAFDENYTYHPFAGEEPAFEVGQGFRWNSIKSEIGVSAPRYEEVLSVNINFGAFNLKTYSAVEQNNENYIFYAYDEANVLLSTTVLMSVQSDSENSVIFELESIDRISIIFNQPITTIGDEVTSGYLYVKSISLSEIKNYSK